MGFGERMNRNPAPGAGNRWMVIFYVLVVLCVEALTAGSPVTWTVTWSPGNELHHLAVDPVSGKVIYASLFITNDRTNNKYNFTKLG